MSTIMEQAHGVDRSGIEGNEDDAELTHVDRVVGAFIELGRSMIHVRRASQHMRLAGHRRWAVTLSGLEAEIADCKQDYEDEYEECLAEVLPRDHAKQNGSKSRKADNHESDSGTRASGIEAASCGTGSDECGASGGHHEPSCT